MAEVSRRSFIAAAVLSVPALLTLPKWLGNPAGGFYAPIPDDLSEYVQWSPWQAVMTQDAEHSQGVLFAVWAPPGASLGAVQMFACAAVRSNVDRRRGVSQTQIRERAVASMRECLERHHEPGWFKATTTIETTHPQGDDEENDPYFYTTVTQWKRAGYVRWLKPSELIAAEYRVA